MSSILKEIGICFIYGFLGIVGVIAFGFFVSWISQFEAIRLLFGLLVFAIGCILIGGVVRWGNWAAEYETEETEK